MKKHWTKQIKEDLLLAKQQRNTLYEILKRKIQPEAANEMKVYMETGMEVEQETIVWSGSATHVIMSNEN